MLKYVACIFFTLIYTSEPFSIEVRYNTTNFIQSPLVEKNGVNSGLDGVKYLPDSLQPSLFGYEITSSGSKLVLYKSLLLNALLYNELKVCIKLT